MKGCLKVVETFDIPKSDKILFDRAPFSSYKFSVGCMHYKTKAFNLIKGRERDNPTWTSVEMLNSGYEW